MSAAQHTPGPWSASKIEDRAAFNIFTPGRCSALLTLEPGKYDGADPRTSNVEADARLIAAAPELLEALQVAVEITDRSSAELVRAMHLKVKDAIAKATGQEGGAL